MTARTACAAVVQYSAMHYIVGLGNPGTEYESTRHNAGRLVLSRFFEMHHFPELVASAKYAAQVTEGVVGDERVTVLYPETFMNKSGSSVAKAVTSTKKAERLIVVYDDIDLPLGSMKIAHGRGSGGHRGVESIIKALKTKEFTRLRIGVAQTTPGGKLRKPKGEDAVVEFLLGEFKKPERVVLDALAERIADALTAIITEGRAAAMNRYN